MENTAPSKILQYHLNKKIGSGFAGDVYHAWDSGLDRNVTVKIIEPELAVYNPYRSQIMTTALSVRDLEHPNVARLYAVEEHNDNLIVVTEYVEGVALKSILERGGLEISRFIKIAVQLIDGLNAISNFEMEHNYFTSSNIIVDSNEICKITDYGLSPTPQMVRNESGFVDHEKLIYMSPELLKGANVTAASDQYSLGIVFYEMLTGKLPFEDNSREELIRKVESPALHEEFSGEIRHGDILLLINKMTATDPEERFSGFDELAATIKEIDLTQNVRELGTDSSRSKNVKSRVYLMTSLAFFLLILFWLIVKGFGG